MSRRYPPFDPFERSPFRGQEIRIPRPPRRFWLGAGLIAAAFLVLALANPALTFVTDLQWFDAIGFREVYLGRLGLQSSLFGATFAVAALFTGANLALALRSRQAGALRTLGIRRRWFRTAGGAAAIVVSLLVGLVLSGSAAARWQDLVLFQNATATGTTDPLYGLDVSFYLLQLPFLHDTLNWLLGLLFLNALIVAIAYTWRGESFDFNLGEPAIAHISVALALVAALLAVGAYVGRYDLVYQHHGVVFGAGYADVNARAPMALVRAGAGGLLALGLLANVALRRLWVPVAALGGWLALVLVASVYPAIVQGVVVKPAELQQERTYISREITGTQQAYGLQQIKPQSFAGDAPLTAQAVADDSATIDNLRLWDYAQLKEVYGQLQTIRTYYGFADVDLDRYTVDGKLQQVELAAREMETQHLPQQAQSWFNQHLVYTHGYGVAASPVSSVDAVGLPSYLVRDIPPAGPLKIDRPAIYFGEETADYAIAPSAAKEFDHPDASGDAYVNYTGRRGVRLDGLNRALWALRLGDFNLLVSSQVSPESQILFNRSIVDRANAVAPFLYYDGDPYLVVADGKLYWVLDAYTVGTTYPYAQDATLEGFNTTVNYVRNSVKVVIDPYDGSLTYYVNDPRDPVLRAYRGAFPTLFRDISTLPPALKAHLRVPELLFRTQARIYATYHGPASDPETLYSRNDVWDIPREQNGPSSSRELPAYYVLMRLPGQAQPEFLLIQPFVLHGKTNLIAWLAARNDGANYGEYDVFSLPRDRVIVGPQQVSAFIQQQPEFSRDVSLLNQQGSTLVQGNLLVVPIGDTFLYFQPVYLRSAGSTSVPELKKVLLAHGDQVVYADSVQAGLEKLVGQTVASPPPPGPGGSTPPPGTSATVAQLVADALQHYNQAQQALRAGDLAAYAREMQSVADDLQKIQALNGGPAPAASPSPGPSPRPSPTR